MPGTVLYCHRLCRLVPYPPSLSSSFPFPGHGPGGPSRRRATCFLSPPSLAPGPPEYLYPSVGGEKKVLVRYYSGIITMRIAGVGATEPPRSRRWLTRESAALSVLPPSERVTGCRQSCHGRNRSLGSDSPDGRAGGGSAAAAGGRRVKFRVSGGSRARCGGAVSLPWHTLAQTQPSEGKWGGIGREEHGAWGSGLVCEESSGIPRQSQGGHDPDHRCLPVTNIAHTGEGEEAGAGTLAQQGCGSCCFSVSCF